MDGGVTRGSGETEREAAAIETAVEAETGPGPETDAASSRGKLGSKRSIALTVLLVVGIGLVANVAISFVADLPSTWDRMRSARWDAFALPFAVVLCCYFIDMLRLRMVSRRLGYALPRREAFMNSVLGFFGSYITPSATGGQFMQVYHLGQNGVDSRTATNIAVSRFVEFLLFTSAMVLFSFYRLPALLGRDVFSTTLLATGIAVSFSISLAIVAIFLNPRLLYGPLEFAFRIVWRKDPRKAEEKSRRVESWIDELKESVNYLWRNNWSLVLADFLLGAVSVAMQAWSLWYVLVVVAGTTTGAFDFVLVFVIMNYVAYYVPTPGSAGGVEGVYAIVLSGFANDASGTAAAVLIWRFSSFYLHLVFQVAWVFLHGSLIADGRKAAQVGGTLALIRERANARRERRKGTKGNRPSDDGRGTA